MRAPGKTTVRTRLNQAAARLAYRRGFNRTSLADLAQEARVPVGNLYYYFKTKDEVGAAIVAERQAELHTLLRELDRLASPRERLAGLVRMTSASRAKAVRGGCPMGTFCSEVNKDGGPVAKKAAVLFTELLAWITAQFQEFRPPAEARGLAVQLLAAIQGVLVLAHSLQDAGLIEMETRRLAEWLRGLGEG